MNQDTLSPALPISPRFCEPYLFNKLLFMLLNKSLLPSVHRSRYDGTGFWGGKGFYCKTDWQGERKPGSNLSPQGLGHVFKGFQRQAFLDNKTFISVKVLAFGFSVASDSISRSFDSMGVPKCYSWVLFPSVPCKLLVQGLVRNRIGPVRAGSVDTFTLG